MPYSFQALLHSLIHFTTEIQFFTVEEYDLHPSLNIDVTTTNVLAAGMNPRPYGIPASQATVLPTVQECQHHEVIFRHD